MQHFWLNKKNNKKLIVFFNGWAMNETPVKHLLAQDFDVLVVFDYRNINFNFKQFDFDSYDEKYLICWSMGVFSANLFFEIFNNFNRKIAINGTPKIIDDLCGIPSKIYKITAKSLNEQSRDKFIQNMFDNGKINPEITITREISELKDELYSILKLSIEKILKFDLAIVSLDDKIIPPKNQLYFWEEIYQNPVKIKKINSTHCPFKIFENWQDLLC